MKRAMLFAALVFLSIFSVINLSAKVFTHEGAQVEIEFPSGWVVEEEEEDLIATTPDALTEFSFSLMKAQELEPATKEMVSGLQQQYSNIEITEQTQDKINGMDAYIGRGTMDDGEEPLAFSFMVICTSDSKILLMLGVGAEGNMDNYARDVFKIIHSIKHTD